MPHIHVTIGEFDRATRSYPVTVRFPNGSTASRRLAREQERLLWQMMDEFQLGQLLFQSLSSGIEELWTNAQNTLMTQPPPLLLALEILDSELNELPWELVVQGVGPSYQVLRTSSAALAISTPFMLPVNAFVVTTTTHGPRNTMPPDTPFQLNQTLASIFGPHPGLPFIFDSTELTGASGEDLVAILNARQFDIVQITTYTEWRATSEVTGSEGVLVVGGKAAPLNASYLRKLLNVANTRLLILHLPSDADSQSRAAALDFARRLRHAGGPAAIVVNAPGQISSASRFLFHIYDAVIHNVTLDVAVYRARTQAPEARPVLFLPPDGERLLMISPLGSNITQIATERIGALNSARSRISLIGLPTVGLSAIERRIDDALSRFQGANNLITNIVSWEHESGGLVPLRQAIELVDIGEGEFLSALEQVNLAEVSTRRVVNTYFKSGDAVLASTSSLLMRREYTFHIQIGPPAPESHVRGAQPIPETYLQAYYDSSGVDLRVCLFSEQFEIPEDSKTLRLPVSGPSEALQFTVVAPNVQGEARLRACVYHQHNLLQSLLVVAQVIAVEHTDLKNGNFAEVEFSLSENLHNIDQFSPRALNILLNDNKDGTHTFAVVGGKTKKQIVVDQGKAVKHARDELLQICATLDDKGRPATYLYRDSDNAGDEQKLNRDLKTLSYWGWRLYCKIVMETNDENFENNLKQDLSQPAAIQISSTRSARYVYPWSIIYDKPLVRKAEAFTCPAILTLLRNGGPPGFLANVNCPVNGCTHFTDNNAICPLRFWGFRHKIEQPPNAGEIIKRIDFAYPPQCVMGAHSKLSGIQHSRDIEQKCNLKPNYSEAKDTIRAALVTTKPHLIYFYCHGGKSEDVAWIGVGSDEHIEGSDFMAWNAKWPETHPLVIINGCQTVDLSPDDLLGFVTAFTWTRASGIIGTEICIPESLAREVGVEFLREFIGGKSVGEIMLSLRLRLLEKYNLLGLAYTPYCYGDLQMCPAN